MIYLLTELVSEVNFMAHFRMMDLHTHTDNSFDGNHSAMFMCENAIRKGLRGIAFTDHFDVDFYKEHQLAERQMQSFFEISKARSAFKGRLLILAGIELGQGTYDIPLSEKALQRFPYDFVIGSIHNLRQTEDFYFLKYNEMTENEIYALLEKYFEEELILAQWNKFDTLAHLTYPLRYISGDYSIKIDLSRFDDIIDTIFKTLAQNGKALEINTSGLRQKIGVTMPTADYVKRFRELGGEFVTVGSDAHFAEHLGAGIKEGLTIAKEAGFENITFFQHREPITIPIERL